MIPNMRKVSSLQSKGNKLMSFLSMSTMCLLITASIVIITIISITPIIILSLGKYWFTCRINKRRSEGFDLDALNPVYELVQNSRTFRAYCTAKTKSCSEVKRVKSRNWMVYGFKCRKIKSFGHNRRRRAPCT